MSQNQTNNSNFWQTLPRPFVGLAPMDGVTDQPFRHIVAKYSQPDVIFTEFTHVSGLCHGAMIMLKQLLYDEQQRPIVAQIYGKEPQYFRQVAVLIAELGFDGVDLNMGCPSKSVAGGGAGAGLIKTPELAKQIIQATQQGIQDWVKGKTCEDCPDLKPKMCAYVKDWQKKLPTVIQKRIKQHQPIPVSVKTRLGTSELQLDDWIAPLLELKPAALTIHGRTLKQGYSGQADWAAIAQIAELGQLAGVLVIGNGDVVNRQEAAKKAKKYGVAGVLIARAAQGDPYVFLKQGKLSSQSNPEKNQPLSYAELALEHAQYFQQYFQEWHQQFSSKKVRDKYSFLPMRKHLAWYIKGVPHAAKLRSKLVRADSAEEVEQILSDLV